MNVTDMGQAVEDAAAWWAGKLGAGYASKKHVFELALAGLLLAEWAGAELRYGAGARVDLEVDYDPCLVLEAALRAAGVEVPPGPNSADGIFPFKTRTRLLPGRHVVRWVGGVPVETSGEDG